jgi:hypothetical protein
MPRQNRVNPFGEFVATPARGTFMGNRGGCLHDDEGEMTTRRWTSSAWISCVLEWKDYRQTINAPGHYTQLFFHDEAVAMAAGHRPCAQCRREAFNRFKVAWAAAFPGDTSGPKAPEMDKVLQPDRIDRSTRGQIRYRDDWSSLPDFAFFTDNEGQTAFMKRGNKSLPWSFDGYGAAVAPPAGQVTVLTPRPLVEVLRAGYVPVIAEA